MRNESRTTEANASHVCPWWFVFTFDNFLRPLLHDTDKLFGPYVGPGMTVLDVGSGAGFTTLGLARLVGANGRVIAADLQSEMLKMTEAKAAKAGLSDRIRLHQCEASRIGVSDPLDFALAFWMLHEVPNARAFLNEVAGLLRSGGSLFIVEPRGHVSRKCFEQTIREAVAVGLRLAARPKVRFSRAAVLAKSAGMPG
jgi:ubiquinone/menaquinone biosynthesis C-methylase UbiE